MVTVGEAFSGRQHDAKLALRSPSSKPPWQAVAMHELSERCLHMDYSLSHGHYGGRPCSIDHIEAVGPVGPAVDQVLSFVITEPSPFALLAALSGTVRCQQPMIFWSMIMKRLTHAKACCVVTSRGVTNHILIISKPTVSHYVPPLSWDALR